MTHLAPRITRRIALLLPLWAAACATGGGAQLSGPDQADVTRVERYLNGLGAFKADFSQVWPDGGQGQGVLSYAPGKLDLDYTSPHGLTLRAADGRLVLSDARTGSVTRMGLSHNPLGLLLTTPIHLSGAITVTSVMRQAGVLQMSLARTAGLSDGLLTLQFNEAGGSLSLAGLRIVDDRHHMTVFQIHPLP